MCPPPAFRRAAAGGMNGKAREGMIFKPGLGAGVDSSGAAALQKPSFPNWKSPTPSCGRDSPEILDFCRPERSFHRREVYTRGRKQMDTLLPRRL